MLRLHLCSWETITISVSLDGFILSSNAITVVFNVLYNDLIDSFCDLRASTLKSNAYIAIAPSPDVSEIA